MLPNMQYAERQHSPPHARTGGGAAMSGNIVVDHTRILAKNNDLLQQVFADSSVRFRLKDFVNNMAPAILEVFSSSFVLFCCAICLWTFNLYY